MTYLPRNAQQHALIGSLRVYATLILIGLFSGLLLAGCSGAKESIRLDLTDRRTALRVDQPDTVHVAPIHRQQVYLPGKTVTVPETIRVYPAPASGEEQAAFPLERFRIDSASVELFGPTRAYDLAAPAFGETLEGIVTEDESGNPLLDFYVSGAPTRRDTTVRVAAPQPGILERFWIQYTHVLGVLSVIAWGILAFRIALTGLPAAISGVSVVVSWLRRIFS